MDNVFKMLAGYNSWANTRLYDAAARMPDSAYRQDGGAFFGSIHRTLNHLLTTDRIWLKRFGVRSDAPDRLDAILFDDLPGLRAAREEEDARIERWIGSLSEDALAASCSYQTLSRPEPITQPLASAVAHLFNHQTHHRGQVHALMTGFGGRDFAPSLDLIVYQRQTGVGMS
jgi:uncharacterized damage-inducible protein DinB